MNYTHMKSSDFKTYDSIKSSKTKMFCESSISPCTQHENCKNCTDFCISKNYALALACAKDIRNFLSKISDTKESGNLHSVEFTCKQYSLFMDITEKPEKLLAKVNRFLDKL